ncbi:MAG TPA: hypothetical protein VD866_21820 [Urbifossiella sp.]|nr:hypothetical protein [Urbifossiella sp.]
MWPIDARVFREFVKKLDPHPDLPCGHFLVHYAARHRPPADDMAVSGVEDVALIDAYAAALEAAYATFTAAGWPEPAPDPASGRVHVYVLHMPEVGIPDAPFTFPYGQGFHLVALRSENYELTREAMIRRAEVEAVHEVAHLFTTAFARRHTQLPWVPAPWYWFDEATALFAEHLVFAGHAETLRYALHWVRRPELPLTDNHGYLSGWFVRYLAARFGPDLLREVWERVGPCSTPLAALTDELTARGTTFREVFAGGYCVDAGFVRPVCARVYERYGRRTLAGRHQVGPGGKAVATGTVLPLGCDYHTVAASGVGAVTVRAEVSEGDFDSLAVVAAVETGGGIERSSLTRRAGEPGLIGTLDLGGESPAEILVSITVVPTPAGAGPGRPPAAVRYHIVVTA